MCTGRAGNTRFQPAGQRPVGTLDVSELRSDFSNNGCEALYGDYAYVNAGQLGLEVIDISQPWNPVKKSDLIGNTSIRFMAVYDKYLYSFSPDSFIDVLDLSDPVSPVNLAGAKCTFDKQLPTA